MRQKLRAAIVPGVAPQMPAESATPSINIHGPIEQFRQHVPPWPNRHGCAERLSRRSTKVLTPSLAAPSKTSVLASQKMPWHFD